QAHQPTHDCQRLDADMPNLGAVVTGDDRPFLGPGLGRVDERHLAGREEPGGSADITDATRVSRLALLATGTIDAARATVADTVAARGLRHTRLGVDLGNRAPRRTIPVLDRLRTGRSLHQTGLPAVSGLADPACRSRCRMVGIRLHRFHSVEFTARRMREEDVRRITPLRSVVVLGFSAGEVAVDVIASRSAPVIGVPVLP